MSRRRAMAAIVPGLLLLAACGGPAKTSGPKVAPAVLAKAPAAPALVRPVATSTTLRGQETVATLTASLTGQGQDTITVRQSSDGDGQVTISDASGATIFHQDHVSGASVVTFGRRHLPVLLLQESFNLCGSGGCTSEAYTWSRSAKTMRAVAPPTEPAYRYSPSRRQFLQTSVPALGGLFGFVVPGSQGIVVQGRTYDPWQHVVSQDYAYAPGLSPTGGWVAVGTPAYAPSGRVQVSFPDPGQALLALLSARSLGFSRQVHQLLTPQASLGTVMKDLAPLGAFGGSVWDVELAPSVETTGDTASATERVTGLVGQGPAARLEAYEATAVEDQMGSQYLIASAHVAPLAVKVSSAVAVLERIRGDRALLKELGKAGDPPLVVQAAGQAWQVMQASTKSTQEQPWIEIDALTGALSHVH